MVRSSSEVLPAPGELIRLTAVRSRGASQPRTCSASSSLRARTCSPSSQDLGLGHCRAMASWSCRAGGRGRGGGRARVSDGAQPGIGLAAPAGHTHVGSFASSTATTVSSLPATMSTSALPHAHRAGRGRPPAASSPQSRQAIRPSTSSISRRAPSTDVPAVGDLEAELHRVGHHAGQAPDAHLDGDHGAAGRAFGHEVDDALGDRQLVHGALAVRRSVRLDRHRRARASVRPRCRRRCTCARRTAGTGRSCARHA